MDMLADLWLPILLSTVGVWIASAIVWMALPHHKRDLDPLPDEAGFIAHLRAINLLRGNYAIPDSSDHSRMKDPEMQRCWKEGPCGFITLIHTPPSMPRNMMLSVLTHLVVSFLIAYVGAITLARGTDFAKVFQVLGTVGVLSYSFAFIPHNIWFGAKPRATVMCIIDGVVYGLITGAVFAAMWPAAAS
jgi:hypothetical protein